MHTMNFDPLLGPAFPEQGWVPAPRYLMRRARVLELAKGFTPGRILETGPGAASLLLEFSARGFECKALELSDEARALAQVLIDESGCRVGLHDAPQPGWTGHFDYLFSFDVLEHIEDDKAALAAWHSWLKPGGTLLLSVPARMSLWTTGDEWAGHFRRYERDQLISMLDQAGFEVEIFECYGFPLTNLTERISARSYGRLLRHQAGSSELDRKANNDRSGIDRRPHLRLYPLLSSFAGRLAIRTFMQIQRIFLRKDFGSGYIARARRR